MKRQDVADARAALGLGPVNPRTSAPRSPAKAAARGVRPPAARPASAPPALVKAGYYMARELVDRIRGAARAEGHHNVSRLVVTAIMDYLARKHPRVKAEAPRQYTRPDKGV